MIKTKEPGSCAPGKWIPFIPRTHRRPRKRLLERKSERTCQKCRYSSNSDIRDKNGPTAQRLNVERYLVEMAEGGDSRRQRRALLLLRGDVSRSRSAKRSKYHTTR